jgi:aminoglycoside phosphotransferase (APT) family kinase protein
MELEELERRLVPFARAKTGDPGATVSNVYKMPGHAGFSYGFTVHAAPGEAAYYLRLPPPNVRWVGTADVLRQVQALRALDGTAVPHCSVVWTGDDLEWFERPYFVVPKLEGGVLGTSGGGMAERLSPDARRRMARQAMTALARIHQVDWSSRAPGLGPPIPFDQDVTRWDRFVERAADPEKLALVPKLRERLLSTLPAGAPVGIFHGDFQWSNLFYSAQGELLAVIDWELVGIGATLNDVGWIATFNDPPAWSHREAVSGLMPGADELVSMYLEAWGKALPDLRWYRALAAYKFAIITGFNLGLHRRGKRPDPLWEQTGLSMTTLCARALELLG